MLSVFCLVLSISALGQQQLQNKYPFLKLEENKIQYPSGSEKMDLFWSKLEQLAFEGKGELNVLHIGGSHVQAGMLSSAMREGLQNIHPGMRGSRGFFFPLRLAHTNEPANYRVQATGNWDGFRCSVTKYEAQWGMGGVTAETTDWDAVAHIEAYVRDSVYYPFRRIRIFHVLGEEYLGPAALDSVQDLDSVFIDESGFTEFQFSKPQSSFDFKLTGDSLAKKFIWQGIQYIEDAPGISYHSIGVNGASTKSYLRCPDFADQLPAVAPDLVIFGIGINDAYMPSSSFDEEIFGKRYDSLMDMFEAANPEVVFLFMSNNDSYYRRRYPNKNAIKVQKVMKQLARQREGAYWDLTTIMGGSGSINEWKSQGLAKKDRIHFTRAGYQLQAELFLEAFQQSWSDRLRSKYSAQ